MQTVQNKISSRTRGKLNFGAKPALGVSIIAKDLRGWLIASKNKH